jgi:hypothetical protein
MGFGAELAGWALRVRVAAHVHVIKMLQKRG